jgi:signal transduction histidine kinase
MLGAQTARKTLRLRHRSGERCTAFRSLWAARIRLPRILNVRHKWWTPTVFFFPGVVALCLAISGATAAETKRVVILHSFGRNFKPWNEYAVNIRAELDRQSRWKLDIHDHSLIAARTEDENPYAAFVDYLGALYTEDAPGLIVSIGAPAANFVQRYRHRLFPAAPIVFTAVEQRRVQWANLTPNDVVVATAQDFPVLFEAILRVLPATRTILVVNGASPNEKFWLGELRRETKPFQDRIDFRWLEDASFEDMVQSASALPPHSVIFWSTMNVDAAGVPHEGERALARLYASASAPIFSHNDTYFGREIVGGPMHSVAEGSRQTATVAMRILNGEKPGDIKVIPHGYAPPKYDWRLLQRWGINESNLPANSQVLFRIPPLWQVYFWQIVLLSALFLGQAGLITGLLYERRRRVGAEVQARQRMAELAHVNRYSIAGELSTSIAHELNQPLGAILNNAKTAELLLNASAANIDEVKSILADICRDDHRASEILRHMRSLLRKVPFEPTTIDLNEVVRESVDLVSAVVRTRNVKMAISLAAVPLPVIGDAIQLQQVFVNFIVNAADAMSDMPIDRRRIEIRTAHSGRFADLSVSDDGPGIPRDKIDKVFDPFFTTKASGMGMGLSIARTIVEAHTGEITAANQTTGGATFRMRLPIAPCSG